MPIKIIYVTGCLGFIGSHFTRRMLESGYYVHGIDKETYAAHVGLLKEFKEFRNFKYHNVAIEDVDHLMDCDVIVNFAAESHVGKSVISGDEFIDSNIVGVKNLLDLIRRKPENEAELPRFLHISTDEVYGDILGASHKETDMLCPSNPYSASKAAADMLINAWSRTYGLTYNIVRPTNNYGKYQYPEKLIPLCVKNILRGKKIHLHNQGLPVRNWLHVEDTVDAVEAVMLSGEANEVYNVSGGYEQQNKDTVRKVLQAFFGEGFEQSKYDEFVDLDYERPGQDVRYAVDDQKIRKLGWSPKRDFDKEIVEIVNFYKSETVW
jgi:dTDP-glucose 4,6-dehydratase